MALSHWLISEVRRLSYKSRKLAAPGIGVSDYSVLFISGQSYYINQYTKATQWEKPSEPAEKGSSEKVEASHLLVKHKDSRRPSSWREENITRTKEEALQILAGKAIASLYLLIS